MGHILLWFGTRGKAIPGTIRSNPRIVACPRSRPARQLGESLLVLGVPACLYLRTMAPGLTWAFHGQDGGDLATAVANGGIPHPTGMPTYLLLAKLFAAIPVGDLAWRLNLMSAVCATLSVWVVYALARRLLGLMHVPPGLGRWAALTGCVGVGAVAAVVVAGDPHRGVRPARPAGGAVPIPGAALRHRG